MITFLFGQALTLTSTVKIQLPYTPELQFMPVIGTYIYPPLQSPTERVYLFIT